MNYGTDRQLTALLVGCDGLFRVGEIKVYWYGTDDFQVLLTIFSPRPLSSLEAQGPRPPPEFWTLASTRAPEAGRQFATVAAAINAAASIQTRADPTLTRVNVLVNVEG